MLLIWFFGGVLWLKNLKCEIQNFTEWMAKWGALQEGYEWVVLREIINIFVNSFNFFLRIPC